MPRWILLVWVLLLAGCESLAVSTRHDPYAELSAYRTFDWMPEKPLDLPVDQQLLQQQLKYRVEQELLAKGIVRDARDPDFLISYYGNQQQKTTTRTVEHADFWSDRNRYDRLHKTDDGSDLHRHNLPEQSRYTRTIENQTFTYTEGTLVIDFVDQQSSQVVWQATIQGVLSRTDPMQSIADGVNKALAQFPPP